MAESFQILDVVQDVMDLDVKGRQSRRGYRTNFAQSIALLRQCVILRKPRIQVPVGQVVHQRLFHDGQSDQSLSFGAVASGILSPVAPSKIIRIPKRSLGV